MVHSYRPAVSSAIDGLLAANYSRQEANTLRPFLPLHFECYASLPSTNYEFWCAHRAVADAVTYDRHKFRFYFEDDVELENIPTDPYYKMCYESPTYKCNFSAIEFIRHFGRALYTERSVDGRGKRLEYINNGLRIKTRKLKELFDNITSESNKGSATYPCLPSDPKEFTVGEVITAWRAGERVNRTLYGKQFGENCYWINPTLDSHDLARYLDLQYYRVSNGHITQEECEGVRKDVMTVLLASDMFVTHSIYHPSLITKNWVYGEALTRRGYFRPTLEINKVSPVGFLAEDNSYSVTITDDVYNMFTLEEWKSVM